MNKSSQYQPKITEQVQRSLTSNSVKFLMNDATSAKNSTGSTVSTSASFKNSGMMPTQRNLAGGTNLHRPYVRPVVAAYEAPKYAPVGPKTTGGEDGSMQRSGWVGGAPGQQRWSGMGGVREANAAERAAGKIPQSAMEAMKVDQRAVHALRMKDSWNMSHEMSKVRVHPDAEALGVR